MTASIRGRTLEQLFLMNSSDILVHSSKMTALRASTFGCEVLLVLPSKTPQMAKSRGFTSGEDEGQKSAGQNAAMFSWHYFCAFFDVCAGAPSWVHT